MGNEEDEESWEAEIHRVRMNPISREKQEHEDSGHVVYRSWCAACVEGRGVEGPILICRDSKYGQTGATCCERKGSIAFLVGFIKDLGFR